MVKTKDQLTKHMEKILNNPCDVKELERNRTAYWHHETGTVIIRNPSALDGGTVFQLRKGYEYFLNDIN